ncbi:MAG: Adenosine specific kinase [Methanomassiliicoccales archaeon PtaB.Bin134]|jgi:adenosine/AMP kinase|nr:MAG: Adenosine specific kinase [Methanomassiliicoccales archaeon PtaB.Bin134]
MKQFNVPVDRPEGANVIVGQSHFIKTAEDLYEAMVNSVPQARFGVAFCEASGDRLVRVEGNDPELMECAQRNALKVGAGHTFFIVMREAYPINVLGRIKQVPEVCSVFCATANDLELVVAESALGRGIIGVIDGQMPAGVEQDEDVQKRRGFLRKIGYKL